MNNHGHTDEKKMALQFPDDFKKTLELLVLEILRQKPHDPLQFASNFFLKQLQIRQESNANDELEEEEKEELPTGVENKKRDQISETQAATIIQSYFRGYNVRQNKWKKRFLVTKITAHDHLNAPLRLDSPRESFCFYDLSDHEDFCLNYESDNSIEDMKL